MGDRPDTVVRTRGFAAGEASAGKDAAIELDHRGDCRESVDERQSDCL